MASPSARETALLLIDVINDCEFDGGEDLLASARATLDPIAALTARCREAGVPVVYVNDNFGAWDQTFDELVERCCTTEVRGRELAEALRPEPGDHFILKPKHSAFYLTSLDALLQSLGVRRLILCGYAGDICVLFTANDAHMREYELVVPRDCIASEREDVNACALEMMQRTLGAETGVGGAVALGRVASFSES